METKQCKMCEYYIQHYGLGKKRLFRLHCGHCTLQRAKRKLPDAQACQNFIPGEADEEAFASKEYLSKELLKYVLEMELLPEIDDYTKQGNP